MASTRTPTSQAGSHLSGALGPVGSKADTGASVRRPDTSDSHHQYGGQGGPGVADAGTTPARGVQLRPQLFGPPHRQQGSQLLSGAPSRESTVSNGNSKSLPPQRETTQQSSDQTSAVQSAPGDGALPSLTKSVLTLAESMKSWQEEVAHTAQKVNKVFELQHSIISLVGHHTEEVVRRELKFHMSELQAALRESMIRAIHSETVHVPVLCHEGTQTDHAPHIRQTRRTTSGSDPVTAFDDHVLSRFASGFGAAATLNSSRHGSDTLSPMLGPQQASSRSQAAKGADSYLHNEADSAASPPTSDSRETLQAGDFQQGNSGGLASVGYSARGSAASIDSATWRAMLEEVEQQQLANRLDQPGALYAVLVWLGVPKRKLPKERLVQTPVERCVKGRIFVVATTLAILLNAIFVGLEADSEMKNALAGRKSDATFTAISRLFVGFFTTELVIRWIALRGWFLLGSDGAWNIVDVLIVATSIFWEAQGSAGGSSSARIIRILRLLRVGRLIRNAPFLDELRRIAGALVSVVAPLAWGIAALVLLIYTFSVFFLQVAADFIYQHRGLPEDEETIQLLREWYSSLGDAMLTLFYSITNGASWSDLARPLASIHDFYRIMFAIFIALGALGVVKILTAVFVVSVFRMDEQDDTSIINRQRAKEATFIHGLRRLVQERSKDREATKVHVPAWWLQGFLRSEEVISFFAAHNLDWQDVAKLFQDTYASKDMVAVKDFIFDCSRLRGDARKFDMVCLLKEVVKIEAIVRDLVLWVQLDDPPPAGGAAQLPIGGRSGNTIGSSQSPSRQASPGSATGRRESPRVVVNMSPAVSDSATAASQAGGDAGQGSSSVHSREEGRGAAGPSGRNRDSTHSTKEREPRKQTAEARTIMLEGHHISSFMV